jgi:hypothetical protein
VEHDGNYYFISDYSKLAKNCTLYLGEKFVSNIGLPAGYYSFDAQGKLSPFTGIMNGRYYENSVPARLYSIVELDGHYYFVSDGYYVATDTTLYLSAKFVEGTVLTEGYYTFDADGKIIQ